ncbi:MAG: chemotaxis protein CheX [Planctomycetes bacterium]|nr:chemotaxis protein CheX [Planctomycetota bacterium]
MQFLGEEIRQTTEAVWTSILGLCIDATEIGVEHTARTDDWVGCVQIAGEWGGALVVACPTALLERIASGMFGKQTNELTPDELRDALGETTNMVGGNLKALLPGVCFLSLPAVSHGGDWKKQVPYARLVTLLNCTTDGVPFTVALLEKTPRPAQG